ncbi:MAG: type II toxin-antitoxin system PemK/MazF family toxin [Deltaproteobacteria bacterium]|nr:type II toxin-antitoxin system PemK/MazF family toxin [Deltaproteobacteria bacterium]
MNYVPKRQDFVWVNFTPQAGHEQAGHRPALVISHDLFNQRTGLVFLCPITNHPPRNNFHVPLENLKVSGCVMADQLKSLDYHARGLTYQGKCPDDVFYSVLARINPILF